MLEEKVKPSPFQFNPAHGSPVLYYIKTYYTIVQQGTNSYGTIQHRILQYRIIQYLIILCSTEQCRTATCYIVVSCALVHSI